MSIGQRFKRARKKRGLSRNEVAEAIGMSHGAIANIEYNHVVEPHPVILKEVCKVLKINEEWLINGTGEMDDTSTLTEFYDTAKELSEEELYTLFTLQKPFKRIKPVNPLRGNSLAGQYMNEGHRREQAMSIAERLKYARSQKRASQGRLAEAIGMTRAVITNIEHHKVAKPPLITIRAICRVLRINEEWLVNGTGEMDNPSLLPELYDVAKELPEEDLQHLLYAAKSLQASSKSDEQEPNTGQDTE